MNVRTLSILLILAALALTYHYWKINGIHSKINMIHEILTEKSSVLRGTKKASTLWQPKDIFDSKELSHWSENKEFTSLKVYAATSARTGNNLFQYVSALGIAHHNNRSVVFNPKMIILRQIFPKIEVNCLNDTPKWKILREKATNKFDPRFFNLPQENIRIKKFFQSYKYFEDIFEDIYNKTLSYFDESLLTVAERFIDKAKHNYKQRKRITVEESEITSVCVHVRRGDMVNSKQYIVPSSLDIQNAMNYMQKKFKYTIFVVMSNDLKWSRVHLNGNNVYFSNLTSVNEDFVLMCSCDHMIMTVGTFGWWGAWLTSWKGGIAMYYAHQFFKNGQLYKGFNRHDWCPPHWLAYTNRTVIESKYFSDK